jgi:F-type H+-transporting ATPase subunit alpha
MRLETTLKQREHHPLSLAEQVIVLSATSGGYMDDIEPADVPAFERQLLEWFKSEHSVQYETINRRGELSEGTRKVLLNALVEYRAAWARR